MTPSHAELPDSRNELAQRVEQLLMVTSEVLFMECTSIERGNLAEWHHNLDRPIPTRRSFDQAASFESEDHVVN